MWYEDKAATVEAVAQLKAWLHVDAGPRTVGEWRPEENRNDFKPFYIQRYD